MKISVLLPSRGRSMQMVATLNSFRSQESGKNEVVYGVACDADDHVTIGTCEILKPRLPLCHHVLERSPSLGGRVNLLAEHMPADAYCSVADDSLCMTQDWDERLAEAFAAKPDGVWWWGHHYPQPALYAIISEKWRAAAGWMFTDYFPYWFDDIWLLELWVMASESPFQFIEAKMADCPRKTTRMRDLAFWHEFWHYTRPQRIKHAKEIAAKLGWRVPECAEVLASVIGRPVPDFVNSMAEIEAQQGDIGPADLNYINAKSRAQEIMGQPQDIVEIRKDLLLKVAPLIAEFDRTMGINQPAAVAAQ